jgi:hypothetical protein
LLLRTQKHKTQNTERLGVSFSNAEKLEGSKRKKETKICLQILLSNDVNISNDWQFVTQGCRQLQQV